jgi:hypothetical protein
MFVVRAWLCARYKTETQESDALMPCCSMPCTCAGVDPMDMIQNCQYLHAYFEDAIRRIVHAAEVHLAQDPQNQTRIAHLEAFKSWRYVSCASMRGGVSCVSMRYVSLVYPSLGPYVSKTIHACWCARLCLSVCACGLDLAGSAVLIHSKRPDPKQKFALFARGPGAGARGRLASIDG